MGDRTERGGKLRILAIIDEYTREYLAIRVAPSIPASAVVRVLKREAKLSSKCGKLLIITSCSPTGG